MNELPLFARHNGTDTSQAAAESVRPSLKTVRSRVYEFIFERGNHGATCDEIQVALELLAQTASARCNDLKRAKLIVDSGNRRPTRTGCSARVYVANEKSRNCNSGQVINQEPKFEGSNENDTRD